MKTTRSLVVVMLALLIPLLSLPSASAFGKHKNGNVFQRHRTLSSLAAGVAAYHVAKHTGKNRMAHGGRRNFAQRHPFLTGVGAAVATHHLLKHHR